MKVRIDKKIWTILAILLGLSNTIVLYATFLAAWLNGGFVTIYIDKFNEAEVEFILIPIMIIVIIIGLKNEV